MHCAHCGCAKAYAAFGNHLLEAGSSRRFTLTDGAMYGIGSSGGILVGQRYRTDLNGSIRIDLNPEHKTTILVMFGVGFHI